MTSEFPAKISLGLQVLDSQGNIFSFDSIKDPGFSLKSKERGGKIGGRCIDTLQVPGNEQVVTIAESGRS